MSHPEDILVRTRLRLPLHRCPRHPGEACMAEKPAFISDQPVDVDIDGLRSFSQYIQQELDSNVRPNVQAVLAQLGTPGERSFGLDTRYDQGVRIGDYHSDCVQKGIELMRSLEMGL